MDVLATTVLAETCARSKWTDFPLFYVDSIVFLEWPDLNVCTTLAGNLPYFIFNYVRWKVSQFLPSLQTPPQEVDICVPVVDRTRI